MSPTADAGDMIKDIDAAKNVHDMLEEEPHLHGVGGITSEELRRRSLFEDAFAQSIDGDGALFHRAAGYDEPGALLLESLRRRQPQPGGAADYQASFFLKARHILGFLIYRLSLHSPASAKR
jgi:hypothetical protein